MTQAAAGFILIVLLIAYRFFWAWRHEVTALGMTVRVIENNRLGAIAAAEWDKALKEYYLTVEYADGSQSNEYRSDVRASFRRLVDKNSTLVDNELTNG